MPTCSRTVALALCLAALCFSEPVVRAQEVLLCNCSDFPKSEKAFLEATTWLSRGNTGSALNSFKKADKLADGKCKTCRDAVLKYALEMEDWKAAEQATQEMIAAADTDRAKAWAHHKAALVYVREAVQHKKPELYAQAHDEFAKAIAAYPNFPDALYMDGEALAALHRYDEAKAQFVKFVAGAPQNDPRLDRARKFAQNPELAEAKLAPPFAVQTIDGQTVSIDDLKGKVVLLDFWATWCGPCREALPHMKSIARNFQGQPFVMLSISLDDDEAKWKKFVADNGMTWPQARAGGWDSALPKIFGVRAIPNTFTIDAQGQLQEEHVGDQNIDGRLKKLIDQARKQAAEKTSGN
jgi:thiol-disulfide isomerase/thioredoxin